MLQWIEELARQVSDVVTGYLGPAADLLASYVWNWPPQAPLLALILLGTGLYVTVRLGLIQIRGFKHAVAITAGRYDDPEDEGDIKHFQALTTALSATVGIGNIAGVALAVRWGGPGALFWMWVTGVLGMALKYAECTLALRYRTVHPDGSVSGGPMYYIERGLGESWKPLAFIFAGFAAICAFATGNMNQSNTMADQMEATFGIHPIWTALVAATLLGMVIIGGIKRIGKVTAVLAPTMAVIYVTGALVILTLNYMDIPAAFALIFTQAFAPESLVGGAAGSFLITFMWGVRRGIYSNEAGQGSAPIAHAAAKTKEPVREGLVASLEPFIDTLLICTMTGLVIVTTGVWQEKHERLLSLEAIEIVLAEQPEDADLQRLWEERAGLPEPAQVEVRDGRPVGFGFVYLQAAVEDVRVIDSWGEPWQGRLRVDPETGAATIVEGDRAGVVQGRVLLTGAPLTARGFQKGLPGRWGDMIVTFAVLLFALSTGISWSYYGDRAAEYLFGSGAIPVYRWFYTGFFFIGAILPLEAVWTFGDVALGLMAFPNLIAVFLLTGQVSRMTKDYMSRPQTPYEPIG